MISLIFLRAAYSSHICYHGNKELSISNFWISEFYKNIIGKSDQVSI